MIFKFLVAVVKTTLKSSLFCLFVLIPQGFADWIRITDSNDAVFYVYPDETEISGGLKRIWELQDLKKTTWKGERSFRHLSEYHCFVKRWRILHYTGHSDNMGMGSIVSARKDGDWFEVPPKTPRMLIFKSVCEAK